MKKGFILLAAFMVVAVLAVGCSSTEENNATTKKTEVSQGETATANTQETTTPEVDVEKETLRVNAAIKLADERLLGVTDAVEVGEGDAAVTYNVVKDAYVGDALREYYQSVYTAEYADQVIATFVSEVEGVGTVITLPEDYVDFKGLNKEDITITIEVEKATATAVVNEKTVTYELQNIDGKWYVASKTVQ